MADDQTQSGKGQRKKTPNVSHRRGFKGAGLAPAHLDVICKCKYLQFVVHTKVGCPSANTHYGYIYWHENTQSTCK